MSVLNSDQRPANSTLARLVLRRRIPSFRPNVGVYLMEPEVPASHQSRPRSQIRAQQVRQSLLDLRRQQTGAANQFGKNNAPQLKCFQQIRRRPENSIAEFAASDAAIRRFSRWKSAIGLVRNGAKARALGFCGAVKRAPADAAGETKSVEPVRIVFATRAAKTPFPTRPAGVHSRRAAPKRLQAFRTFGSMLRIRTLPCEQKAIEFMRTRPAESPRANDRS